MVYEGFCGNWSDHIRRSGGVLVHLQSSHKIRSVRIGQFLLRVMTKKIFAIMTPGISKQAPLFMGGDPANRRVYPIVNILCKNYDNQRINRRLTPCKIKAHFVTEGKLIYELRIWSYHAQAVSSQIKWFYYKKIAK